VLAPWQAVEELLAVGRRRTLLNLLTALLQYETGGAARGAAPPSADYAGRAGVAAREAAERAAGVCDKPIDDGDLADARADKALEMFVEDELRGVWAVTRSGATLSFAAAARDAAVKRKREDAGAAPAAPAAAAVAAPAPVARSEAPPGTAGAVAPAASEPLSVSDAAQRAHAVTDTAAAERDAGALVGAAVLKRFAGHGRRLYPGRVTRYDPESRRYAVEYVDGDREDASAEELSPWLVQPGASSSPAAAAAAATAAQPPAPADTAAARARAERSARRAVKPEAAAPAPAAAAPAKAPKVKRATKAAAPAHPKVERKAPAARLSPRPAPAVRSAPRLFLPLRTQRTARWRVGTPRGGLAALAGTWRVYASYLSVGGGCDDEDAFFAGAALVRSSGTLALSAASGREGLTGVLTSLVTGTVANDDNMGPCVPLAHLEVMAQSSAATSGESLSSFEEGTPKGTFRAAVTANFKVGYYWTTQYEGPAPYRATLDMRACADELVPSLVEDVDDGYVHDAADFDGECDEWQTGVPEALAAELEKVIDRDAPPLLLRAGDVRLDVRWMERGGHSDAGCGVAYLLRRDATEEDVASGAAAAQVVSAPCEQVQSWDRHQAFRFRDHF
jgi:hypothetical protein